MITHNNKYFAFADSLYCIPFKFIGITPYTRRKMMKILTIVLSVMMATSAFGMYAPTKKHCGTIYLANSEFSYGVHVRYTMDDTPGDGEVDVFDFEISATNEEVRNTLNRVGNGDYFMGCVYSDEFPVQGYEGMVVNANKVELLGMQDYFETPSWNK